MRNCIQFLFFFKPKNWGNRKNKYLMKIFIYFLYNVSLIQYLRKKSRFLVLSSAFFNIYVLVLCLMENSVQLTNPKQVNKCILNSLHMVSFFFISKEESNGRLYF